MSGNKITNDISDEMLQMYLAASDTETPDLWNRVEQGFEQEISDMHHRNCDNNVVSMDSVSKKKKFAWRNYAGLVAAILICLIVVPVIALLGRKNQKKGDVKMESYSMDGEMADDDSGKYQDAEESTAASMEESAAVNEAAADSETDGIEADTVDDVQAVATTGTMGKNTAALEVQVLIKAETTEEGTIIFVAEVQAVEENEDYSVEAGDILEFDNAAYVEECVRTYDDGLLSAVIMVSDVVERSDGRYMCHYLSGL